MLYNDQYVPTASWPQLVRYPTYQPDRRLSILWFLGLAIVALGLSVTALIIVFAVEHAWFHDSFNQTSNAGQYGLWRLCFYSNGSCDSWFSSGGPLSGFVQGRLNQARVGINAWQALEIIFLFLTTATLVAAIASAVFYRIRNSLYYYLAILALFCVWPAASIGISGLFVFGFAVFNVATAPRDLDWCFYVNLVAVILTVIAAILLSIYGFVLKKPIKHQEQDTVVETFADLNGYPAALSPSTFVIVRKNKNKRRKNYDYPQILHPNHYFTSVPPTAIVNPNNTSEFVINPNHQMLTPYTSLMSTQETTTTHPQQQQRAATPYRSFDHTRTALINSPSATTIAPQPSVPARPYQPSIPSYQPSIPPYQYQIQPPTAHWHRTGVDTLNRSIGYTSEPAADYVHHGIYRSNRFNPIERTVEPQQEPRIMHYYTGYDYFATVDPSDVALARHQTSAGPGTGVRYTVNPSYRPQSEYLQSTM